MPKNKPTSTCLFCGAPIRFTLKQNGRYLPTDVNTGGRHSCERYREDQAAATKGANELQLYLEQRQARGGLTWQTAIPRLRQTKTE